MRRLLPATLLMAAVGSGYYYRDYFLGTAAETRPPRPPATQPVGADVAAEISAPIEVAAIGNVQSIATVMVKSRADGEIAQVHFEEGQEVKNGDLLFSLDDRVARAQLQQSEANLERDRAQLRRFQLEVTRQTGLANRGIASRQKLEDVITSEAVFESTGGRREAERVPSSEGMWGRALIRGRRSRPWSASPSCGRATLGSRCPKGISAIFARPWCGGVCPLS